MGEKHIKDDKVKKSYDFFKEKELKNQPFTMAELLQATSWKKSTVSTYPSKKWHPFLTKNGDKYTVKGISQYSEEEYKRLMSQVNTKSQDPLKPLLDEEVEQLVIKARESALLAIDIYNRPATTFKSEGFIVMMIIAWTSLLHAVFRRNGIKYCYLEKDGSDKKTKDGDLWYWELETCVTRYFQGKEKAITSNLLFMVEIRRKIEHRFVRKIDNHITEGGNQLFRVLTSY